MKRTTLLLFIMCVLVVSLNAQKREVRDLDTFTEISLRSGGTIYLTQGNQQKVELKGDNEILDKVETTVRSGKLVIDVKDRRGWYKSSRRKDFEIYITMKKLEGISVSGSGKLIGENTFNTDNMDISVSGSGRMELELDAKEIEISIAGSGRIELKGTAQNGYASISGSGRVRAEDLKVDNYKVRISGSGSCDIYAVDEIDARISGSGSIYYRGNPPKVNSSSSGSGRIKKI